MKDDETKPLDTCARLLLEAELLSEAPGASIVAYSTDRAKGHVVLCDGRREWSIHEQLVHRFNRDRSMAAIEWARGLIDGVKHGQIFTMRHAILVDWRGEHPNRIASITGVSVSTVRRWRQESGMDATTGEPNPLQNAA